MWIFQPAPVAQSQAMSTLRRAQRPSQLLALLEDMPQQQVTPNEISVAAEPGKNLGKTSGKPVERWKKRLRN